MNDRIRELANQVERIRDLYNIGPVHRDAVEQFAELIVRECASICELNGQSYKHSFTPAKAKLAESTSVYCGTLIMKHFGVEA
jgi:hypothetical protein